MKRTLLLLIIPFTLTIIWFRNGLITGGGEEGILFYNPGKTLQLSTSVWVEYTTGGSTMGWLSKVPLAHLAVMSEKIGLPPFIFQATIFYLLMVIGMFSVYYLTLFLLDQDKSKIAVSLVSAFFYLFNPYSFSQVWGRGIYAQYFSFALLPLTLLLFYLGIKTKKYIFSFFIVLAASALATAYGFLTFIVVYWFATIIYLIYAIIVAKDKTDTFFFGIKFTLLTFIFWCFINAWWLMPLFLSAGSVYTAGISGFEENLGTLLGVSRNFTPDILIRLLQRTYFFDASAFSSIYSSLTFQLISWLPVIFVLFGLIKVFKDKLIKFGFFATLFLLGLVVSLGANFPFGWLFVEIFKKIVVLQAFRNPFEKFGLVLVLGYSSLFAYGLVSLFDRIKFKNLWLILILFLTCGIFAWPMWTGRVIAGPDKKIGISVPSYYKDLQEWLNVNNGDYRLLMTPIWSGDGAFYQWNGGSRYQGSDPMVFILDQPSISNRPRTPFVYDFVTSIRKYMERVDIVPALSLLRAKFLIDRKDAILITDREKDQYKFLTSFISPPKGWENELKSICGDMMAEASSGNVAWIVCQIPQEENDFSKIRYLHLKVKTDVEANLEVALRDIKGTRIRWDERVDPDYHTDTNDWKYITVPLSTPTEYNSAIDFSKSFILEILAHPKDEPQKSVGEIKLFEIKLDPGIEKQINEFSKVAEFGNLTIFEPLYFNSPPEFGSLSKLEKVSSFIELFDQVNKKRDSINTLGFILPLQNSDKDLDRLVTEASLQILDKQKISSTRYWLKADSNTGGGLIILSKTFDPQWKVISGMGKEMLGGNLFDDLSLLKRISLDEKDHYVVNGYANLWKIDGQDTQYAILFMPQVIADIALKVSIFSALFISGITGVWILKKYIS